MIECTSDNALLLGAICFRICAELLVNHGVNKIGSLWSSFSSPSLEVSLKKIQMRLGII